MHSRVDALVTDIQRIHAEPAPRLLKARWYGSLVIAWARWTWIERRRRYLLGRAYVKAYTALGVRAWRPGDSTLRYILTEPWDAAYTYVGRFACRVLHQHNASCRGRLDHLR